MVIANYRKRLLKSIGVGGAVGALNTLRETLMQNQAPEYSLRIIECCLCVGYTLCHNRPFMQIMYTALICITKVLF